MYIQEENRLTDAVQSMQLFYTYCTLRLIKDFRCTFKVF